MESPNKALQRTRNDRAAELERSTIRTEMEYRLATEQDLDLLAEWNHQLIRDEGHRNQMTVPKLRERMKGWLAGEYKAVVFLGDNGPVAYGLYRESHE